MGLSYVYICWFVFRNHLKYLEKRKFLCCKILQILSAMQSQDFLFFFKQTGIFFQDYSIKYDYSLLLMILISYFTFICTVGYLHSGIVFRKKDESVG